MDNTDKDKYDLKKLIKYPGFNVDPSVGTRDVRYIVVVINVI